MTDRTIRPCIRSLEERGLPQIWQATEAPFFRFIGPSPGLAEPSDLGPGCRWVMESQDAVGDKRWPGSRTRPLGLRPWTGSRRHACSGTLSLQNLVFRHLRRRDAKGMGSCRLLRTSLRRDRGLARLGAPARWPGIGPRSRSFPVDRGRRGPYPFGPSHGRRPPSGPAKRSPCRFAGVGTRWPSGLKLRPP